MTAAQAGTSLTAYGIDLIDKDDGGRGFFRILKQITDTGCAHAHVHLHEVRTGNGEEGYAGFAGNGLGQKGLTGSGRANQQHTVGNLGTQLGEVGGIAQKLYQFFQFCLFLIGTGHVLEEHLGHIRRIGANLGTTEGIGAGAPAAHSLIGSEDPHGDQKNDNNDRRQKGYPGGDGLRRRNIVFFDDALLQLFADGVAQNGPEQAQIPQFVHHGGSGLRSVFQNDADVHPQFIVLLHNEGFDTLSLEHFNDVAERNVVRGERLPKSSGGNDDHTDHHYIENCVFQVALHELLRMDLLLLASQRQA